MAGLFLILISSLCSQAIQNLKETGQRVNVSEILVLTIVSGDGFFMFSFQMKVQHFSIYSVSDLKLFL